MIAVLGWQCQGRGRTPSKGPGGKQAGRAAARLALPMHVLEGCSELPSPLMTRAARPLLDLKTRASQCWARMDQEKDSMKAALCCSARAHAPLAVLHCEKPRSHMNVSEQGGQRQVRVSGMGDAQAPSCLWRRIHQARRRAQRYAHER